MIDYRNYSIFHFWQGPGGVFVEANSISHDWGLLEGFKQALFCLRGFYFMVWPFGMVSGVKIKKRESKGRMTAGAILV